ncbi:MAG: hypothetical protein ACI81R_001912 [Bradymonadia bacterium]|jgi:hypothetical protein
MSANNETLGALRKVRRELAVTRRALAEVEARVEDGKLSGVSLFNECEAIWQSLKLAAEDIEAVGGRVLTTQTRAGKQ